MPLPGPRTWQSQSPQQALPLGISAPVMSSGFVFDMGTIWALISAPCGSLLTLSVYHALAQ